MAAKLAGPGGGGRFHVEANSEINVTPFVDVMMVLLIIFMVATSVAAPPSIKINLPNASAPPSKNPPKPVFISIRPDGAYYLGEGQTSPETIGGDIKRIIGHRDPAHERIYIRGDKNSQFGDFQKMMAGLQDSGFYSVALIGEQHDK